MHNLTAADIKDAKPGDRLTDGGGLRLEVDAKGNASWIFRYTSPVTRKERYAGLGRSVNALRTDIASFISTHNADPKPFRWTKSADDILASIERFCRYNTPAKA